MRACILQLNTESIHYIYYIKKRPFSRNKIMLHNVLHFFQTQHIHHCNNRSVMICKECKIHMRIYTYCISVSYLYHFSGIHCCKHSLSARKCKRAQVESITVIQYKIKRVLRFPVAKVSYVVVIFTRRFFC